MGQVWTEKPLWLSGSGRILMLIKESRLTNFQICSDLLSSTSQILIAAFTCEKTKHNTGVSKICVWVGLHSYSLIIAGRILQAQIPVQLQPIRWSSMRPLTKKSQWVFHRKPICSSVGACPSTWVCFQQISTLFCFYFPALAVEFCNYCNITWQA